MAFALIATVSKTGSTNGPSTTTAIDTTGANLLIMAVASNGGVSAIGTGDISDSKSNTWVALTGQGLVTKLRLFYCYPVSVGSGHTFTVTKTSGYASLAIEAWSGADTAFDPSTNQSGTASDSASTLQPGSLTPAGSDYLMVTGLGQASGGNTTIDSSFTEHDEITFAASTYWGLVMAYRVMGAASAVNPTWTMTGGNYFSATAMVTFKPSTGGGGGGGTPALMQMRSGIARAGASRSDYYYLDHFHATVGATVIASPTVRKVTKGSLVITEVLRDQPDSASLEIFGTSFTPTPGQEIVIGTGSLDNRAFAGNVIRVEQRSERGELFYTLECQDYHWLLNKKIVTKHYEAQPAHLVIIDILQQYASGFTFYAVDTSSPNVEAQDIKAERVGDAITRIANSIGWQWYVDYSKDVHFYLTETLQGPADLTPTNRTFDQLRWRPTIEQIRTRVYAEGGGSVVDGPIVAVSGVAAAIHVPDLTWFRPVFDAAFPYYAIIGATIIRYARTYSDTGGLDSNEGSGYLLGDTRTGANFTIGRAGDLGIVPYVSEGAEINYLAVKNSSAGQTDLAALEGGDGIREHFVQDRRLGYSGAEARASAELSLYREVANHGSFKSYDKFCRAGRSVAIDLPDRGIDETVKLQRVRRRYTGVAEWVFDCEFQERFAEDFYSRLRSIQRAAEAK